MSEILSNLHPIVVCIIVCIAKIVEISIQSLKTVMMVKGQRLNAALLGFVECLIWGLAISTIISTLGDNYLLLLFYCFGYAVGLFLGNYELNLIMVQCSVNILFPDKNVLFLTFHNNEAKTFFSAFKNTYKCGILSPAVFATL